MLSLMRNGNQLSSKKENIRTERKSLERHMIEHNPQIMDYLTQNPSLIAVNGGDYEYPLLGSDEGMSDFCRIEDDPGPRKL